MFRLLSSTAKNKAPGLPKNSKKNFFRRMKGQSTLEYAVLIVIIIGALLTIQVYVKRGVQGRLKSASDDIGDQFSVGNTNVLMTTKTRSETRELFGKDEAGAFQQGVSLSKMIKPELTNTQERSQIVDVDQEFWGKKGTGE